MCDLRCVMCDVWCVVCRREEEGEGEKRGGEEDDA